MGTDADNMFVPLIMLTQDYYYAVIRICPRLIQPHTIQRHHCVKGAKITTADLFSFVVAKCGGNPVYKACAGFQLPMNVHYTPEGWTALAAEMQRNLLLL